MVTETSTSSIRIGMSDLSVYPLGLGTNTFNNPAEPAEFHAVLNGFVERGGNFLDTADMYSHWVDGNTGGDRKSAV